MPLTKITDWMEAIKAGDMTVEEIADRFRDGALKAGEPPLSMEESLAGSGSGFEPGTFDEVTRALHLGLIDIDQYGILAEAAAGRTGLSDEAKPAAKTPVVRKPPAPKPEETEIPDDSTA